MYSFLIRPIFFLFDAEKVHHFTFKVLNMALSVPMVARLMRAAFSYDAPALRTEAFGLSFRNPVGLAAGFDKDGILADKWADLGFGFVEVGTVTPRPQAGNDKPRLFRLPQDRAVLNRMGFNNAGVDALVARLAKIKNRKIIIGANIGKNKDTPNENAGEDYRICFEKLHPYVDYFVVNVSSPNTPGLRALQEKGPLTELLQGIQTLNAALPAPKPLLLKIAPDLTSEQIDDIIEVAYTTNLAGLVAANTTISREGLATDAAQVAALGNGGISGAPLTTRSNDLVLVLQRKMAAFPDRKPIPIIGVGGIMAGADAAQRLQAGACLVQTYTGFIYAGPAFAKAICKAIVGR